MRNILVSIYLLLRRVIGMLFTDRRRENSYLRSRSRSRSINRSRNKEKDREKSRRNVAHSRSNSNKERANGDNDRSKERTDDNNNQGKMDIGDNATSHIGTNANGQQPSTNPVDLVFDLHVKDDI